MPVIPETLEDWFFLIAGVYMLIAAFVFLICAVGAFANLNYKDTWNFEPLRFFKFFSRKYFTERGNKFRVIAIFSVLSALFVGTSIFIYVFY